MSASVPVKVIVPSLLPSPTLKLRPTKLLSVSFPCVAVRVICINPPATSTSAMLMALPLLLERTSVVSSLVACGPTGRVMTGASFTAFTVIATESVSVSEPPMPVLPRSSVVTVSSAPPL